MDSAQPLPSPPPDPVDGTPAAASSSGSFWTGASGLLAGLATVVGSFVGLATVLVQAGVIGSSSSTPAQTAPARTQSAQTQPAQSQPVRTTADAPSLDRVLSNINALLAESARTKGNLGSLIVKVQSNPPAISRETALTEIDTIVRQREDLHATLAALRVPDELAKALALLRDSITVSLADDRLVRLWIIARFDGDPAADRLDEAQREASQQASRAKSAFRAEYTDRLLAHGLSSFIPDY
jgi:hypothetical protein